MRLISVAALLALAAGCADDDHGPVPADAPPLDAVPLDAAPLFPACPGAVAQCGFADDGWNVWCADGQVWVADLTEALYCDASQTILCEIRTRPDPFVGATCATSACATTEPVFFGDHQTYQGFDKQSLCSR